MEKHRNFVRVVGVVVGVAEAVNMVVLVIIMWS
jgi:hypothetical protein